MNYRFFLFKRQVENIFIFPFVCIGKIIQKLVINTEPFDILFIFPFYHTGGAEKVHALIANTFKNKKALILFTRKSTDVRYFSLFKETGHSIVDISRYTDNKLFYWNNLIFRGIIAKLVNNQPSPTIVFNGQSNFGYKLSPWIKKSNKQLELIHAFSSFSWIRLPFLPYYSSTIMISNFAIEQHRQQYQKLSIPDKEFHKIHYITNGIFIPEYIPRAINQANHLKVLYVGRGTPEKRLDLIGSIAKEVAKSNLNIEFSMIGDVKNNVADCFHPYIHFLGAITNEDELYKWYGKHDVLLMTSLHEGFPISIMEAMAAGCTIVSTPVGDIPHHVRQDENGYLFSSIIDESIIKNEAIQFLNLLLLDPQKRNVICQNNQEYARKEFDLSIFEKRYRNLFEQSN